MAAMMIENADHEVLQRSHRALKQIADGIASGTISVLDFESAVICKRDRFEKPAPLEGALDFAARLGG